MTFISELYVFESLLWQRTCKDRNTSAFQVPLHVGRQVTGKVYQFSGVELTSMMTRVAEAKEMYCLALPEDNCPRSRYPQGHVPSEGPATESPPGHSPSSVSFACSQSNLCSFRFPLFVRILDMIY